jgi:hypothetical protein
MNSTILDQAHLNFTDQGLQMLRLLLLSAGNLAIAVEPADSESGTSYPTPEARFALQLRQLMIQREVASDLLWAEQHHIVDDGTTEKLEQELEQLLQATERTVLENQAAQARRIGREDLARRIDEVRRQLDLPEPEMQTAA